MSLSVYPPVLRDRTSMKQIPLTQIETPALLIDLDALERNIRRMADYFKRRNATLRPHFKTHKCPEIARRQVAAGAEGITCAKVGEAEALVSGGIDDVFIANQIVAESRIRVLAELARRARIAVAVDNAENIASVSDAAQSAGTTLHLLVEVNVGMNRCGVDTQEEVLELAKKIIAAEGLAFDGIQAYEGHLVLNPDFETRSREVGEMIEKITCVKVFLEQNGIEVNRISGGGTGTYNLTGDNINWTEIQAGSYIFMDTKYNQLGLEFENALTVLATVIHKRPGVAVTDAGLKVCTAEFGMPRIKGRPELALKFSAEHGSITDPNDQLQYLQKIEYIPSHCCTTVNLYDSFCCVRNGKLEDQWQITARGKSK